MFTNRFVKLQVIKEEEGDTGIAVVFDLMINPFHIKCYCESFAEYINEDNNRKRVTTTKIYTSEDEFDVLMTVPQFEQYMNQF